jgi:hypothetical protein
VSIIPVTTSVPGPQSQDNKPVIPCKVWFFFVRPHLSRERERNENSGIKTTNSVLADLYLMESAGSQYFWVAVGPTTGNLSTV